MTFDSAALPPPAWPVTPHQSYHKRTVVLGQITGIISAAVAGVGVATGMTSPGAGPLAGYVVPGAVGVAIASGLGIGWHVLQIHAARVRRPLGYVATATIGAVLAASAIAISSWAIATSLSGHAAESAYLDDSLTAEQRAFNVAANNARREYGMAEVVKNAGDQLRTMTKNEEGGALSKKIGHGPMAKLLEAAADRFDGLSASMNQIIVAMQKRYDRGMTLLQEMPGLIGSDDEQFGKDAVELQAITSQLAAFKLSDRAKDAQAIDAAFAIDDVKPTIDAVTATVMARAADVEGAREAVVVPIFRPISPRVATGRYALTAAIGGWLSAVGMDTMPLLFVVLTLCTAKEALLMRPIPPKRPRSGDSIDYDGREDGSGSGSASPAEAEEPIIDERAGGGEEADAPILHPFRMGKDK